MAKPVTMERPDTLVNIPVVDLLPNIKNPRNTVFPELEELTESIKKHGLIQPLLVTKDDKDKYVILAGHRRARAAMNAGMLVVPCMFRPDIKSSEQMVVMLVENTQRRDLSPIEQGLALSELLKQGKGQNELALLVSKSQAWVSNRLGMLELPEHIQKKIIEREITVSEAEEMVRNHRAAERGHRNFDRGWAPPFFSDHHPLSKRVKKLCKESGHNGRRKVGGMGCGGCWEYIIRLDERTKMEALKNIEADTNDGTVGADTPGANDGDS